MSQSAATQALAELERVLDMKLFERHARGMRPTIAGQALIDTAHGVLAGLQEVAESLASIRRPRCGWAPFPRPPCRCCRCCCRFYDVHAQVHVDVHEDTSAHLLSQLVGSGLDAVFCRQPEALPATFVFEPLLLDAAVVIADAGHALVGRRDITLKALKGARWVLPSYGIAVRNILEAEVLPMLEDASWFCLHRVTARARRAADPARRGFAGAAQHPAGPAHPGRVRVLDVHIEGSLPPLGAVYRRERAPALLLEMLRLWHRLQLPHAAPGPTA